ncbi:MAG: hypothetical protein J5595_10950 [Bacteroidales bacterium]|jgi:hypothetical protein|nr:hypothetical protein [Bacteroidales bacterium]
MKRTLTIMAAIAISTAATAQTPDEVTSWDVLANGKEYTVTGPGIWSEDDSAYLFKEVDYEQTFSLDENAERLTIAQISELRSDNSTDDAVDYQIQTLRTVSVHEVDVNGEYLDYLGTIRGKHNIGFKSLQIVKYGNGIGLHDYNNNQMWILTLPAREPNRNE